MQRVRIGLTGLAFVFLAVLMATVLSRASDEDPITANAIEEVATTGGVRPVDPPAEKEEPLAELGVAPGNSLDAGNESSSATVPVEDPLRPQRQR